MQNSIKVIASLLLCFSSFLLAAATDEADISIVHCFNSCPENSNSTNPLIIRPIYTLSYNTETKVADWVAYTLTVNTIGVASSLPRELKRDEFVSETLTRADFANQSSSDWIAGNFVPIVSFAGTPFWRDINLLTNVLPISSSLNQGAWYGLNWSMRNMVNRIGEVHVLVGPLYYEHSEIELLESSKTHKIPDAVFAVLVTKSGRLAAFVLDQSTAVHVHHCDLLSDVESIEQLLGFELFPGTDLGGMRELESLLGCYIPR